MMRRKPAWVASERRRLQGGRADRDDRLDPSKTSPKHLGVMLEAGIVRRRKVGNYAYYSSADEASSRLCESETGTHVLECSGSSADADRYRGETARPEWMNLRGNTDGDRCWRRCRRRRALGNQ